MGKTVHVIKGLIHVNRRACAECLCTQHAVLSPEQRKQLIADCRKGDIFPECHLMVVRARQGLSTPEHNCCFGYFYHYWQENSSLTLAVEEGRIRWLDTEGWPTLHEAGLVVHEPFWEDIRVPIEGLKVATLDEIERKREW